MEKNLLKRVVSGPRIGRLDYFLWGMAYGIIFCIIISFLMYFMNQNQSLATVLWIVILVLYIPYLYITIKITGNRFHDLDRSAWYILWFFVPFYNIYLAIILLFQKWTEWKNRFWVSISRRKSEM